MKRVFAVVIPVFAAIGIAGSAYALGAISVSAPIFPVVGQADIQVCDTDGVTTTYTYGNSSAKGVKVESGTISGIDAACKTATMEFVNSAQEIVKKYSGAVAGGSATLTTNIFTDEFDSVRIILAP